MSDIQRLAETGADVITELNTARHAHITTILALAKAEQELALSGAHAENRAIITAGGEKALGANADARKRALLIALSEDGQYQKANAVLVLRLTNARTAQAEVAALEDSLGLLKALLYVNASRN